MIIHIFLFQNECKNIKVVTKNFYMPGPFRIECEDPKNYFVSLRNAAKNKFVKKSANEIVLHNG